MKRLGRYDAFDKWEILCRYWEDPSAVPGPGTDEWGRQLVPKWHSAALTGGTRACLNYIVERSRPLAPGNRAAGNVDGDQWGIDANLRRLAKEIGSEALRSAASDLIHAMVRSGYLAACESVLPEPVVSRLREVFKLGSLEALRWTLDDGEVPSLAILREQAGPFPAAAIRQRANALSLFSCRFRGRSDVIHLYDACVDEVTLVDIDAAAMSDMKLIYPARWNYVHSDYAEYLDQTARSGQKWDLVVADPWMTMSPEVAWHRLPNIAAVCSGIFMTNYVHEMFRELQVEPDDLEGLSLAVTKKAGMAVQFMLTLKRTPQVFWAAMTIGA